MSDQTMQLTPTAAPAAAPAPKKAGGRASGLLKSSAVMAAGTLVSRLTGFVRTMIITAALGAATLGDAWTVAYTLPTMIYILTVGGGLNSVFVPQLVRSMKEDEDGGEAYANRLLTLVMVALAVIVTIVVFAAPVLIQLMSHAIASNPPANNVAVTFARYCLPTIFFMGIHVVMGQILNARGKFGAMMWTPVLNNIVMIATFGLFLWVYGTAADSGMTVNNIPADGIRLLGIGTLLGLVVQAVAMVPYLRETGFRFRLRFDWRGHGLGKAVALAKWTVLFVLANQAGVLVVTQLATAAGKASARAARASWPTPTPSSSGACLRRSSPSRSWPRCCPAFRGRPTTAIRARCATTSRRGCAPPPSRSSPWPSCSWPSASRCAPCSSAPAASEPPSPRATS